MMDGQCTADELDRALEALDRSPALKARWSRMALAREALAGTRVREAAPDFAFDVMAAIEADEQHGAPAPPKVVPLRPVAATVVASAPSRRRWQPAVGLAAAASITALALVAGGRLLSQPVGVAPAALQAAKAEAIPADLVATVAATAGEPRETRWAQIDADAARQLNDYLMEHSNSRAEAGMGGSLSYARLAVRTADYRQADGPR